MTRIKKIFVEYGLDFDNNKYGFGRSVEIEYADGTEVRTHQHIKLAHITERYIRIWVGCRVLVISSRHPHISLRQKNRWNFKIVYGKCGVRHGGKIPESAVSGNGAT